MQQPNEANFTVRAREPRVVPTETSIRPFLAWLHVPPPAYSWHHMTCRPAYPRGAGKPYHVAGSVRRRGEPDSSQPRIREKARGRRKEGPWPRGRASIGEGVAAASATLGEVHRRVGPLEEVLRVVVAQRAQADADAAATGVGPARQLDGMREHVEDTSG
jgi:hypothetical protein